jgi:hypothetical protein
MAARNTCRQIFAVCSRGEKPELICSNPHTRRLAEEIIASQVIEIEGMKRRLAVLRGEARANEEDFPALGGTRGPEE